MRTTCIFTRSCRELETVSASSPTTSDPALIGCIRGSPVPPLFRYFRDVLGLPLLDCLKTFNWGVGYYIFVAKQDVDAVIKLGKKAGYQLADVGVVEDGNRQVVFEPETSCSRLPDCNRQISPRLSSSGSRCPHNEELCAGSLPHDGGSQTTNLLTAEFSG